MVALNLPRERGEGHGGRQSVKRRAGGCVPSPMQNLSGSRQIARAGKLAQDEKIVRVGLEEPRTIFIYRHNLLMVVKRPIR